MPTNPPRTLLIATYSHNYKAVNTPLPHRIHQLTVDKRVSREHYERSSLPPRDSLSTLPPTSILRGLIMDYLSSHI